MKRIQAAISGRRMSGAKASLVGMVLGIALAAVPAAHAQNFFDDFNRPDNPNLGNGWVQKNAAFSLAGNAVIKAATSTGFADNLVYRPAGENMQDGEASVAGLRAGAGGDDRQRGGVGRLPAVHGQRPRAGPS